MGMILSVHNVKVLVISFAQSKNAWLSQSFHLKKWKVFCTHTARQLKQLIPGRHTNSEVSDKTLQELCARQSQNNIPQSSNARAFAPRETQKTDGVILSEGWALKTAKKSARFNEAQKKYLEEKFNIEQRTGHKQNPEHVVKDVRFAKKKKTVRGYSRAKSS